MTETDLKREIRLTIPLVPPSVNHYKMKSRHGHWYVTPEATGFKHAIAIMFGGREFGPHKAYELDVTVYLGAKQRGDGDNFWKVIADGLKDCGAIHSDAAVTDWYMHVRRDRENPRTEIVVREARG